MKIKITFILLFVFVIASCTYDTGLAQRELNQNKALWNSQSIEYYSYIFKNNSGGYHLFWRIDKLIQISNNKICLISLDEDDYRYTGGLGEMEEEIYLISNTLEVKPEYYDSFLTVEQWFDSIQNTIDTINEQLITEPMSSYANNPQVTVTYNQEYGYPTSMRLQVGNNVSIEAPTYTISNFQID